MFSQEQYMVFGQLSAHLRHFSGLSGLGLSQQNGGLNGYKNKHESNFILDMQIRLSIFLGYNIIKIIL